MLENSGGRSGGQGRGKKAKAAEFPLPRSQLTFIEHLLCAGTVYSEHSQSLCYSTAGCEKVEFQEAKPLGQSPVLVSRGPGIRGLAGSLRSPPSELPSSAPRPRSPWTALAWVRES